MGGGNVVKTDGDVLSTRTIRATALFFFFLLGSAVAAAEDATQPAPEYVKLGLLRERDLTPFGFLRLDMRPAHAVWASWARAHVQSVSVITEPVVALEVSDVVSTVFRSRLGNCCRTRVSGQESANKGTGGGDVSALAARHMCRRCKRSYVRGGSILCRSDGRLPGRVRP